MILINPTEQRWTRRELAKKAIYEIGGNYQAIAVYDEAADWYERYAEDEPEGRERRQGALRRRRPPPRPRPGGRGHQGRRRSSTRTTATRKPAQTAAIAFAIGAHYAEQEDWDKARKRLPARCGSSSKNATSTSSPGARAARPRLHEAEAARPRPKAEYAKVRGALERPQGGRVQKIMTHPARTTRPRSGASARRSPRSARLFFFAEEKRDEVEKIKFPDYKGPGAKEAVLKHIKTKVDDWMKKKRPAIEKAQDEYMKIVELQPTPPPKWVIAAGSRVGQLWGNFVARVPRGADPRRSIKKDTELRNAYYDALDEASRARQAAGEGGVRDLPRVLGEVPVLRRVLAQVRGLALEELQGRVPRWSTSSAPRRTTSAAGSTIARIRSNRRRGLQRGAAAAAPAAEREGARQRAATDEKADKPKKEARRRPSAGGKKSRAAHCPVPEEEVTERGANAMKRT